MTTNAESGNDSPHHRSELFSSPDPSAALPDEVRKDLRDIVRESKDSPETIVRNLLRAGIDELGVEGAHLTRIRPGPGTHTVQLVVGEIASLQQGATQDLASTYCRDIVATGGVLALHNAPHQGWADDPAYQTYALECYLGTKVLVGNQLYGTVCFVAAEARDEPFTDTDRALIRHIAHRIGHVLEKTHDDLLGADLDPASGTSPQGQDPAGKQETKRKLQIARTQFRQLVENAGPIVFMIDDEGTILVSEGEDLSALDLAPGELVGESIFDLYEDNPEVLTLANRALSGEQMDTVIDIRGTILDLWFAPYKDPDGNVAGGVGMAVDVTAQREAEKALQEERDLMDRVFQTSPTAIAILNSDGQFVQVSDRAQDILGLDQNDVTDRAFNADDWHLKTPDGRPFPEDELPFARVKRTGETVFNVEHTIEWPDGTRRLLSVSGAPLHGPDGSFLGAVFHLDDITERRKVKRDLRKSEQRFRGIFDSAALGIALLDAEGTILEANPALESMLGYESGALEGQPFQSITHPDDLRKAEHSFTELMAEERDQYQSEKRYVRRDGSVFWGRLTVSRQEGADSTQIIGMVEDIDQQKKRKEKLRLFRKMVEHANEAIILSESAPLDGPGPEIQYVNQAFTDMTGYEPQEIIGHTGAVLRGPATDLQAIETMHERLQNGKATESETINYRKDGTPFVNHWKVAPIRNDKGEMTHLVSIQRDVTEHRRIQEQLLDVQEEERRRIDQEIHDKLGGLLTTLQMSVELARREIQNQGVSTSSLDDIENLVGKVSASARSISRKLYPSALPDEGLVDALSALAHDLSEQGLEVELRNELEPDERFCSLIERTAFWIVQEVLTNAARHAEAATAHVTVSRTDRQLRMQMIGVGAGFDPSVESNPSSFGIAWIERRVESLDGTLDVTSSPDGTPQITATLPLSVSSLPR